MRLTYAAYNHQGKADAYLRAMGSRYQRVALTPEDPFPPVDIVLTDNDVRGRRSHLERLRNAGARLFFIYPHAARPNLVNDIRAPWPHTTAQFVAAEGHAEIMRRFGYPHPVHVVGWHLCPQRAFQAREYIHQVLFAPIHPRCAKVDQALNRAAFERLLPLAKAGRILLTVRYIGSLADGGLERVQHRNVLYTRGELKPGWAQIDQADVVVSHQTFAWLAVARGVPTVMMGEDMPTHLVPRNQDALYVQHWQAYADLLQYPLDLMKTPDPLALLQQAARSDAKIAAWRARMIGRPFDPQRLLQYIAHYERQFEDVRPPVLRIRSRYQGRGDIYYIVNKHGVVHDCPAEHAIERIQAGCRLATDDEIKQNAGWGVLNRIVR